MSTTNKAESARINGAKSRGPITEEGRCSNFGTTVSYCDNPYAAAEGSDPASVYSDGSSIQAARTQAERTGAQDSRGAALGSVRDRVAGWLGRTATAARPKLPADSARGMSLGVLTLTALLVGLLGWALLSWPPFPRR